MLRLAKSLKYYLESWVLIRKTKSNLKIFYNYVKEIYNFVHNFLNFIKRKVCDIKLFINFLINFNYFLLK